MSKESVITKMGAIKSIFKFRAKMAAATETHSAMFDLFWMVNKVVFVGKHGLDKL